MDQVAFAMSAVAEASMTVAPTGGVPFVAASAPVQFAPTAAVEAPMMRLEPIRGTERGKEPEQFREQERARDSDRVRESGRGRDPDRGRNSDRGREPERGRESERKRELDRGREMDRGREVDRGREPLRVREGTTQGDVQIPQGAPRIVVIPPQDYDLKHVIDRLAFFVAKMGERFEKVGEALCLSLNPPPPPPSSSLPLFAWHGSNSIHVGVDCR
jgi:hypothetical protein